MKIDLNRIKVAVFDFDDTLAIHRNKSYAQGRTNEYFIQARLYPDIFYTEIEPCYVLDEMQQIVIACREHNVIMYCLSGMRCSLHALAKEKFIQKHYGKDIELLTAKTQEMKLEVLAMFAKIHNCGISEILYIDDYVENIDKANELGFAAYNVMQLSELI